LQIVDLILRLLDHQDLHNARRVNRHWNQIARPILQDNCLFQLRDLDNSFPIVNAHVTAGIPVAITGYDCYYSTGNPSPSRLIEVLKDISVKDRLKVVDVGWLSTRELNRLIPFMLAELPRLEHVKFYDVTCKDVARFTTQALSNSTTSTSADSPATRCALKTFQFQAYTEADQDEHEVHLDPGFLPRCGVLKVSEQYNLCSIHIALI